MSVVSEREYELAVGLICTKMVGAFMHIKYVYENILFVIINIFDDWIMRQWMYANIIDIDMPMVNCGYKIKWYDMMWNENAIELGATDEWGVGWGANDNFVTIKQSKANETNFVEPESNLCA